MKSFRKIIDILTERKMTIATMESCTGGGVANAITNELGSSNVINFSAVTYSNDAKKMMGVDSDIINTYTVYSIEVAREMALKIKNFANSDIGVGITGKLNNKDSFNDCGIENEVFVSIYYKNKYYDLKINVLKATRKENKEIIIDKIIDEIELILDEKDK